MRPPVLTKSSCSYIVGRRYFAASSTSLALCELKNADARISRASARAFTAASKAPSKVSGSATSSNWSVRPRRWPASSVASAHLRGVFKSRSTATRRIFGSAHQQFQAFCAEFGIEKRDPRHVAAGVRQIAHRAGRDGVSEGGKDNRDRRGCFLDGANRQRRGGDDHVWPERHEFGREPWNGLGSAGSGAIDVGDAPALDIAEIIHASAEGLEMLRQPGIKNSNLRKRGPLLRARRERPRGRSAEQSDEGAPPHSITSLARVTSDGGRSRPSALAVLRLIVNSILVGNSIGRSPGSAPFRIRST